MKKKNTINSLIGLLDRYEVAIPAIQRDYAQGRKGKNYIRKSILGDIKMFLDEVKDEDASQHRVKKLDFVYGNYVGNRFYPLDGQQRLTTLWLIHWYVLFQLSNQIVRKEYEKKQKLLTNFYYETRVSSTDFCKSLCEKMGPEDKEKIKEENISISDYIKNQTWFYATWLQDPTVCAMLRMISGDGKEKEDNIEGVFGSVEPIYYTLLFDKPCVVFELKEIGDDVLPLDAADDLFIKMNARGKVLSNLDNFKSDLVANMTKSKTFEEKEMNYFASRLDNEWTDVFWKDGQKQVDFDGNIEDLYFSFINRYVVNVICLADENSETFLSLSSDDFEKKVTKGKNEKEAEKEVKKLRKLRKDFDKLYGTGLADKGKKPDDTLVSYEGFEVYEDYLKKEHLYDIDRILAGFQENKVEISAVLQETNIVEEMELGEDSEAEKASTASDSNEQTELQNMGGAGVFIPCYIVEDDEKKLQKTTQKDRNYFYAICLYLGSLDDKKPFNQDVFKKWMRIVHNLIENSRMDTIGIMIQCLKTIDALGKKASENNWDIYNVLYSWPTGSDDDSKKKKKKDKNYLKYQLEEEKEKANIIWNLPDSQKETMENNMIEAEKHAFFNGSIRFLYRDENGDVDLSKVCEIFNQKWQNAKKYFYKGNWVQDDTIKELLSYFKDFSEIENQYLFTHIGYANRKNCWKLHILWNDDLKMTVHNFLMANSKPDKQDYYKHFIESSKLLKRILGDSESYLFRYALHTRDKYALFKYYKKNEGLFITDNERFGRLSETSFERKEEQYDEFYWGINIEFTRRSDGQRFVWKGDNDRIYEIIGGKEKRTDEAKTIEYKIKQNSAEGGK